MRMASILAMRTLVTCVRIYEHDNRKAATGFHAYQLFIPPFNKFGAICDMSHAFVSRRAKLPLLVWYDCCKSSNGRAVMAWYRIALYFLNAPLSAFSSTELEYDYNGQSLPTATFSTMVYIVPGFDLRI